MLTLGFKESKLRYEFISGILVQQDQGKTAYPQKAMGCILGFLGANRFEAALKDSEKKEKGVDIGCDGGDIGGYRQVGGFFLIFASCWDFKAWNPRNRPKCEFLHQELAAAMMEMTFNKNETIFEQGVPCFQNHTAKFENAETIKIRRNICVFF